jgi:hypothetical protein
MDSRTRRLLRKTLPCLLIPLVGAVLAGDDGRPVAGAQKASVSVHMLRTARGGATIRTMSMGPFGLAPGEKVPPTVFAVGGGPQGCSEEMTVRESPDGMLGGFPLVWTVDVEVRSVSTDAIVLGIAWERLTRAGNGRDKLAGSSKPEQVTLREGERVLLDFADRFPSGEALCAQSVAIEVTAEVAEDPALAHRQIRYDLWLVHDAPGRPRASRQLELTTTHGQQATFQFPHQTLPVLAKPTAHQPETALQVDVKGTLRGRVRPDGTLDVSLETHRSLWYVSSHGGEHVGDGGQKFLHLGPQEIIRVDLPGTTRNTMQPERYARDLSGHSFALILRARPLESDAGDPAPSGRP